MELINKKAKEWLSEKFDKETRNEVQLMINNNEKLLIDSFYKDLEFGTGGLRGIMGVGTNRINKYTIGMATQGLCNYIRTVSDKTELKAAIAYDCRNNSEDFAKHTASVFSANGFKVYLFDALRPTPELSFAIRHFNCDTGVVITASHNPKEYNGYKAYWSDGAQIISPHDNNIIEEVRKITDVSQINFDDDLKNVEIIGEEIDRIYIESIAGLLVNPDIIKETDLKLIFTPLHGTTTYLVPMALKYVGFHNFESEPVQSVPDGNFPSVNSPNPEEPSAFEKSISLALKTDADIIMGSDPDGDRLGLVVKTNEGNYELLNGNQTASILIYYILSQYKEKNKLKENDYIVKTIVTSDLLSIIAERYNIECYNVLTGFKYIADIIERNQGKKRYLVGGEESYGYLVGDLVRDKDAVSACLILTEIAAWAKKQGKTLFDILIDIYVDFEYYLEDLISITKKGKEGLEEITAIMNSFRLSPPDSIAGQRVVMVHDFEKSQTTDMLSDLRYNINLPKSNVLQFELLDGTRVTVRPSGTEPKIKYYVSVHNKLESRDKFTETTEILRKRINNIFEELR